MNIAVKLYFVDFAHRGRFLGSMWGISARDASHAVSADSQLKPANASSYRDTELTIPWACFSGPKGTVPLLRCPDLR